MRRGIPPPILFLKRQKENGRWSRPREKTLSAELAHKAQVRLNAGAVLANCRQSWSLLPARAGLFPQTGVPRVYTAAINAGGRRKACPPSLADATSALPGERQRKEQQRVSGHSKTHAPSTPRTEIFRTSTVLSHRAAFFSLGPCTARSLFGKTKKRMGGAFPPAKPTKV